MSVAEVKEHLEFLGFDVEVVSQDDEDGRAFLRAKHARRWNIRVSVSQDSMLLRVGVLLEPKSSDFAKMNAHNAEIGPVKVSLDDEGDLDCALYYIGAYDRQRFGFALDALNAGITTVAASFSDESS